MKKLVIYGDSISTINHGKGGYEGMLKQALALAEISNFSIGSSGLTRVTPKCMLEVLEQQQIPEDADLFLIWHGSNDWYWGSSMEEFSAAIRIAVDRLRAAAPGALLAWVTPIYRLEQPAGIAKVGEAYDLPNKVGCTMLDYYEELEHSAIKLGFPLIDMRRLCGIHRDNAQMYLEDKVHPNHDGYVRIGAVLEREIRRILL
ncbi:hypothetical protein LBYZC6_43720 [Lacrimispora brassicae]